MFKSKSGLIYLCVFVAWMLVYSAGFYFWFHGDPPVAFVMAKDLIAFLFMIGALCVRIVIGPTSRTASTVDEFPWFRNMLIVAAVYLVIDIQRAGDLGESLHGVRDFLMPMILALIGFSIGERRYFPIGKFLHFVSIVGLPVVLLSLYEFFAFQQIDLERLGLVGQIREFFIFIRTDGNGSPLPGIRTFGVFDSPLGMALFCVMLGYNAFVGWGYSSYKGRILHVIAGVLAMAALLSTYTRTAALGLIVSICFAFRFKTRTYLIVGIPLAVTAVWVVAMQTLAAGGGVEPSTAGHVLAYIRTFAFLAQNPLGYGASFAGTRPGQIPLDGDYLNVILNFGPLGLVVFLYVYMRFLRKSSPIGVDPVRERIAQTVKGSIISFLVIMAVLMVYPTAASWIFHLWLGVLLGTMSIHETKARALSYVEKTESRHSSVVASRLKNA